jgi:hypothetical protein
MVKTIGDDSVDMLSCKIGKDGKMDCSPVTDPGEIRALPVPAWLSGLVIVSALVMVIVATVLNHLLFSLPSVSIFVFPFFGGIEIERWTMYDVTLFLFVGATLLVSVVLVLAARRRTRIIVMQ